MGLLPREASYAEEVTDFFLAFRGSGVALSALDAELVLAWQEQGVPYDVVVRAIRRTAEKRARDLRPGEPALATLRSCKREVEAEWKKFRGASAGRASRKPTAAPKSKDRIAQARATLRKLEREGNAAARGAAARVHEAARGSEPDPAKASAVVARLDDSLALLYLRALEFPARLRLLRDARATVGPALRQMSPRARKAALRAHRVLHARAHGELPVLR